MKNFRATSICNGTTVPYISTAFGFRLSDLNSENKSVNFIELMCNVILKLVIYDMI